MTQSTKLPRGASFFFFLKSYTIVQNLRFPRNFSVDGHRRFPRTPRKQPSVQPWVQPWVQPSVQPWVQPSMGGVTFEPPFSLFRTPEISERFSAHATIQREVRRFFAKIAQNDQNHREVQYRCSKLARGSTVSSKTAEPFSKSTPCSRAPQ